MKEKKALLVDAHTHRVENISTGVLSVEPADVERMAGLYPGASMSAGFHPWSGAVTDADEWALLEHAAQLPCVVAIGEAGFDRVNEGCAGMAVQKLMFERHVELSESVSKPLVVHCVRGWDMLLESYKRLRPRMPWMVHGFRGNVELMRQLTARGFYISLGERFNERVAAAVPAELLLVETDESSLPIEHIAGRIMSCRDDAPCFHSNLLRELGVRDQVLGVDV